MEHWIVNSERIGNEKGGNLLCSVLEKKILGSGTTLDMMDESCV